MNDNLNEIEIKILDDLYKREFENDFELDIGIDTLPLVEIDNHLKVKEAGYYLERLKRLNYIEYKDKSLLRADGHDNRYKNNIHLIWWDDIHITYKGKKIVENIRKSTWDKVIESGKDFIKDIGKEIRSKVVSHIATFILGIILSYLYYLIFVR